MQAEVTVVIPAYNAASTIERCLEGVRSQTLRPLKLIVADNNSSDTTADIVQAWARKYCDERFSLTLLHETTPGASSARQCGLTQVDTVYVQFFDADDCLRPHALESLLEAIRGKELAVGAALHHMPDGSVRTIRRKPRGSVMAEAFHHGVLCTGWLARTDFLRACGGWNPALRIWDDWELSIRMLLHGVRIGWVDSVCYDIYSQPDSVTGDTYCSRLEHYPAVLEAVRKDISDSTSPDKARLLRLVAYREIMLAGLFRREGRLKAAAEYRAKALNDKTLNTARRFLLRMAYAYISRGGRGAARIIGGLL